MHAYIRIDPSAECALIRQNHIVNIIYSLSHHIYIEKI